MANTDLDRVRMEILGPLKDALQRIDEHLVAQDLRSAGIDMIAFVQLTEQHAHELLALANRLSGTHQRLP